MSQEEDPEVLKIFVSSGKYFAESGIPSHWALPPRAFWRTVVGTGW